MKVEIPNDTGTVLITVGIPGSGKSTFINSFLKEYPDFIVIHPDSIRKELTGSEEDQSKNAEVFALAFSRLSDALLKNKRVLFDSCAQTKKRRKAIIDIAKRHNAHIISMYMKVPLDIAKKRNLGRSRVVPEFVLNRMHKELEEPSVDEGIHKALVFSESTGNIN
jgi:predicted kinase